MTRTQWFWLAVVIAVIGVFGSIWWRGWYRPSDTIVSSSKTSEVLASNTSTATNESDPFSDLTIPNLRQRNYSSELAEPKQLARNSAYTSYLTSYQSDGFKVNALLTVPSGKVPEGGWPGVVFIHGYIPPKQYTTTGRYVAYVDYLARRGFAVLKIDLRGHGQSEGEASGAYYSSDYIVDTLSAYDALSRSPQVNPDKIGLWGHSMAGNVVLRSLAVQPSIPAAVIWGGAVFTYDDWQQFGISDNSYRPPEMSDARRRRRQELEAAHGQFDPQDAFWQEVAPTKYLSELKTAIQLHHAENDTVVTIGYSRNLAKLLEAAGVTHQLFEYDGGGHNIESPYFSSAMERTVEFFTLQL